MLDGGSIKLEGLLCALFQDSEDLGLAVDNVVVMELDEKTSLFQFLRIDGFYLDLVGEEQGLALGFPDIKLLVLLALEDEDEVKILDLLAGSCQH